MGASKRRGKERRTSLRVRTRSWVRAEYKGSMRPIRDLSTGGVFVRLGSPPTPGTEIEITLHSVRFPKSVRLKGIVRRSVPNSGMGVEFASVKGEGKVNLSSLLSELIVPRIMLASQEKKIQRDMTRLFNKDGLILLMASDGSEALELTEVSHLDLVLLDMDMVNPSGVEVLEKLRSDKDLENTPIVAMSASGDATVFGIAQRMGVIGCIPKPIDKQRILSFVQFILER